MKNFIVQNSFITFAALEPAKPLNDAQIGGSFFYYTCMKTNFIKPYSSPKQIIQILKTRGMLMEDTSSHPFLRITTSMKRWLIYWLVFL